jgi:hypothetical protein
LQEFQMWTVSSQANLLFRIDELEKSAERHPQR